MAPEDRTPPNHQQDAEVAGGGPAGVGATPYADHAERLLDNGYEPLPLAPGRKTPIPDKWTRLAIDAAQVARWRRQYPEAGIGLRTGVAVGIDIDAEDPDVAHAMTELTISRLGHTFVRVGRWPRRLLLYRTDAPFAKMSCTGVEILGKGQQFVAFGIHQKTGLPYSWIGDSPLDVAHEDLPLVDEAACRALLVELAQLSPEPQASGRRRGYAGGGGGSGPVRDADGRVTDGRDGWLSAVAYHAVHDALDRGGPPKADQIAAVAWRRFEDSTDLSRARQDGDGAYSLSDAAEKVADKLRLLREDRLPPRTSPDVEAPEMPEAHSADEARARLDAVLDEACAEVETWHVSGGGQAPQIGVKATVGLGKSSAARRHVRDLSKRLGSAGLPSRILILTPTLTLADETADAWRAVGADVAVLRGYERQHRALHRPMCANLPAVKAATDAGEDVQTTACLSPSGARCARFEGCLKQANRNEVAQADVVVAAYDALFTGFAMHPESIGLVLIDEGFWQRAHEALEGLTVETFALEHLGKPRSRKSRAHDADAAADLYELRLRAARAFAANGEGPLYRDHLVEAGLTVADAQLAARRERGRSRNPGLYPGMSPEALQDAERQSQLNARSRLYAAAWDAIAGLLDGPAEADGRLVMGSQDGKAGLHPVTVLRMKTIHPTLKGKPVLHLDATLRPELARTLLPKLRVVEIAAETPHMRLRLITGPFGKGSLCDSPRAAETERQRRANRLAECTDYVRWHSRRFESTLVITYKDIEADFADIPGVEVAHFNAIAGLDVYRDVDLLIVIGRPLPGTDDLERLSAALFGHVPEGRYRRDLKGVLMRSGPVRGVRVMAHGDDLAEVLRAAICDDELVQAIGRGRGVNRTADDPLEVHVLADVALPLLHDQLSCWEFEVPDVLQQMLLAGIAVDSPTDAALLHPALLGNEKQAQKAFERAGFKRQTPVRNLYREMSLKSAAYRRPGKGRGWQCAYWIDGTAADANAALECAIGPLAEWRLG